MPENPAPDELASHVIRVIAQTQRIPVESITLDSTFEELKIDSLDGINIRMISQGASLLNISFVVSEADLFRTVGALHDEFFSELDPAVFERNEAVHA